MSFINCSFFINKNFSCLGYNAVFVLIPIQFCLLVTYADGIKDLLQKISIGLVKNFLVNLILE